MPDPSSTAEAVPDAVPPFGSASDVARQVQIQTGLLDPDRPDGAAPRLHQQVTEIDDVALSELHSEMVQWANYLATAIEDARAEETTISDEYDAAKATFFRAYDGAISNAPNVVKGDADVIAAKQRLNRAAAYRRKLEAHFGNMLRTASFLSREQTRREGVLEQERRSFPKSTPLPPSPTHR